jgi:hypothetical protein
LSLSFIHPATFVGALLASPVFEAFAQSMAIVDNLSTVALTRAGAFCHHPFQLYSGLLKNSSPHDNNPQPKA